MEDNESYISWQELLKIFLHEKQHKEFLKLRRNKNQLWNIPGSEEMSKEEIDKCFERLKLSKS